MSFPHNPIGYKNSDRCYWCNNNDGHLMGNPDEPCYCVTGVPDGAWIDYEGDLHLSPKPVEPKPKPEPTRNAVTRGDTWPTPHELCELIDDDRRHGIDI
jgi:hypothetical protein